MDVVKRSDLTRVVIGPAKFIPLTGRSGLNRADWRIGARTGPSLFGLGSRDCLRRPYNRIAKFDVPSETWSTKISRFASLNESSLRRRMSTRFTDTKS